MLRVKLKIFFLLVYLLILAQPAQSGTIWKWSDENNVIHYSDIKKKIPVKYQNLAEEINVAGTSTPVSKKIETPPAVQEKKNKEKSNDSAAINELAAQIYTEITRDRNIITYVGNQISLSLTRESLESDLIKKVEILNKIEAEKLEKPQIKTWLTQNINQERSIADTLKGPVTEDKVILNLRKAQENLGNNLKDKEKILATLTQK